MDYRVDISEILNGKKATRPDQEENYRYHIKLLLRTRDRLISQLRTELCEQELIETDWNSLLIEKWNN